MKKRFIVMILACVMAMSLAACGSSTDSENVESAAAEETVEVEDEDVATEDTDEEDVEEDTETTQAEPEDEGYELSHGELLNATESEIDGLKVLVIKAKISSSYNNDATVLQNYYNVEDLIQDQGCDNFDEIQYWAVADMSDGSETKVVSFTVDADLIQQIAEESVVANQLGDYVSDLYIHNSLLE